MTVKESSDLAPTTSLLIASLRRVEETPKPGIRARPASVLEMLQWKSVGIRQDISSIAQSYYTPHLLNTNMKRVLMISSVRQFSNEGNRRKKAGTFNTTTTCLISKTDWNSEKTRPLLSDMDEKPLSINATDQSFGDKLIISGPKKPLPTLPSRPRFIARRKSLTNRNNSSSKSEGVLALSPTDNWYVDEGVAQTIWCKYKLSKKDMDFIWKECNSESTKVLDKDGFIFSMGMIETLLKRQEHTI
ncbi:hypothetical protein K501DRAFT_278426 [Backusella circina FSU 941]|nr:hypothetical protein K501DRAFT_278426 [Backusella circina FSU 941]